MTTAEWQLVLTPLLTLLSVIGGALLAFRFNSRLEDRKARIASRNAAYVDFLVGFVEARAAKDTGNLEALNAAVIKVYAAKMRIGIYGNDSVVDAIVAYDKIPSGGAGINEAFLDIHERMRADGLDAPATRARVSALLFPPATKRDATLSPKPKSD